jgi:hypothetical protein
MVQCEKCGKIACDRPLSLDDDESWELLGWQVCGWCGNNNLCPECWKVHNCAPRQAHNDKIDDLIRAGKIVPFKLPLELIGPMP